MFVPLHGTGQQKTSNLAANTSNFAVNTSNLTDNTSNLTGGHFQKRGVLFGVLANSVLVQLTKLRLDKAVTLSLRRAYE